MGLGLFDGAINSVDITSPMSGQTEGGYWAYPAQDGLGYLDSTIPVDSYLVVDSTAVGSTASVFAVVVDDTQLINDTADTADIWYIEGALVGTPDVLHFLQVHSNGAGAESHPSGYGTNSTTTIFEFKSDGVYFIFRDASNSDTPTKVKLYGLPTPYMYSGPLAFGEGTASLDIRTSVAEDAGLTALLSPTSTRLNVVSGGTPTPAPLEIKVDTLPDLKNRFYKRLTALFDKTTQEMEYSYLQTAVGGIESRDFLTLSGTTDYIQLSQVVSISGDFDISATCLPVDDTASMILAKGDSSNNCIFVSAGNLSFRDSAGTTVNTTGAPVIKNRLNKIRVVRESGAVHLYVNGVLNNSGSSASLFEFVRIGTRFTSEAFFWEGVLADIAVDISGTPAHFWPLDKSGNTIIDTVGSNNGTLINSSSSDWDKLEKAPGWNYWLGEELITQYVWENPDAVGSQWTFDASSNTWTMVGDGSLNAMQLIAISEQPDVFFVSYIANRTSGSGSLALTASSSSSDTSIGEETVSDSMFLSDNPYYGTLIATKVDVGGQQFKRRGGSLSVTLHKPLLKRALVEA